MLSLFAQPLSFNTPTAVVRSVTPAAASLRMGVADMCAAASLNHAGGHSGWLSVRVGPRQAVSAQQCRAQRLNGRPTLLQGGCRRRDRRQGLRPARPLRSSLLRAPAGFRCLCLIRVFFAAHPPPEAQHTGGAARRRKPPLTRGNGRLHSDQWQFATTR